MNTRQFSCQLVFIKQRVEILSLLKNLAIVVSVIIFFICFQIKSMALVILSTNSGTKMSFTDIVKQKICMLFEYVK